MAGKTMAEVVYNWLLTDVAATGLRNLVIGAHDNIFETGDLTEEILVAATETRRSSGLATRVLAIAVQEGPESPSEGYYADQTVIVRIYDRDKGYKNIRDATQWLIRYLKEHFADMTAGIGVGHLATFYSGRTGHRYDSRWQIDYEAVSFRCVVLYASDT